MAPNAPASSLSRAVIVGALWASWILIGFFGFHRHLGVGADSSLLTALLAASAYIKALALGWFLGSVVLGALFFMALQKGRA